MGNGQSSLIQACGVPADDTLREAYGHTLTAAEIDTYAKEVKSAVTSRIESLPDRYQRYYNAFDPNVEQLIAAAKAFTEELQLGLKLHKTSYTSAECSLKMIDAYVPRGPDGTEEGIYYALDFGGSNFRILRVELKDGKVRTQSRKASLLDSKCTLPKGLLDPKATATMMFDFFAEITRDFLKEVGDLDSGKTYPLGFTFSYPCSMRSLQSAELIVWTKGFETGRETDDPVEGCDVGTLMNMAFKRNDVPLRVTCIANDTVGTLLSCGYTLDRQLYPACAVGMILGTGVNAAYVEERALEYGYHGLIINMESGALNRLLPSTNIDHEVDFSDVGGRGRQHYEKMVSGAYLGEICRRALIKIFQCKAPTKMYRPYSFASEDAAAIIGDKSDSLVVTGRKCRERWGAEFSISELQWVRGICEVVFRRSAALAAMQIAGTAMKTGKLQRALGGLTVAIDGSLWKCNPFYRNDIREYLVKILGEQQAALIHLESSDDGSGLGAAILAAVAAN